MKVNIYYVDRQGITRLFLSNVEGTAQEITNLVTQAYNQDVAIDAFWDVATPINLIEPMKQIFAYEM